ncbi:hypothetical protein N431DRAFT_432691 [Stipitochalara longipes BDJ]|nr:hypothetical protein N431DRAFT_432691 [Stipitochalara longipes BDJ]
MAETTSCSSLFEAIVSTSLLLVASRAPVLQLQLHRPFIDYAVSQRPPLQPSYLSRKDSHDAANMFRAAASSQCMSSSSSAS